MVAFGKTLRCPTLDGFPWLENRSWPGAEGAGEKSRCPEALAGFRALSKAANRSITVCIDIPAILRPCSSSESID